MDDSEIGDTSAVVAEADVRAMVRLLAAVAAVPGGVIAQKRALIAGVAGLIGADFWMWNLSRFSAAGPPAAVSLVHNLNPAELAAVTRWNYEQPDSLLIQRFAELSTRGERFTRRVDQLCGEGWLRRERATNPLIAATPIADSIMAFHPVPSDPMLISGIGLHRCPEQSPFGPREVRLAHIVFSEVPWLHEAVPAETGVSVHPISPRLQTVLTLLIDGQVPKEIARELELSVHTIRDYIKNIYRHFEVSGREELMRRFMVGDGRDVAA
jgi:DNA-binding CsgD family transcriptional regulator